MIDFERKLIDRLGKHCEDIEPAIYIRGWMIERARVRRLRDQLDEATGGPFGGSVADIRVALREARMHVLRQLDGRHEQDRADAKAWLEKWGEA